MGYLMRKLYAFGEQVGDDEVLAYFDGLDEITEIDNLNKSSEYGTDSDAMCRCTDKSGQPKRLFVLFEDAIQTKKLYESHNANSYKVYPCPISAGWHLSTI